jgi:hypothetical protein
LILDAKDAHDRQSKILTKYDIPQQMKLGVQQ